MDKPAFNHIKNTLITRDSLGIESTVFSIAGDLCPIVTTVTPRAFYWAFLTWIYNEYSILNRYKERSKTEFNHYLKKNDYYFVLATVLSGNQTSNLAGITKARSHISSGANEFSFDDKYVSAEMGGMQYYIGGCRTMQFIVEQDEEGRPYAFPKLSSKGKELAEAFSKVIENTEYYRNYRNNEKPVPKDVLIEYGSIINPGLNGFNDCKQILRESLFHSKYNTATRDCARFLKFLYTDEGVRSLTLANTRQIFFDYYSPRGEARPFPELLKNVIVQWEIETGRRYFVIGLEMIWKYMMEKLSVPQTANEWINRCITESSWTSNINRVLADYLSDCVFSFTEREAVIDVARRNSSDHCNSIENGLKLILAVFRRFKDRSDIGEEERFLRYGNGCVSIWEMMNCVEKYATRPAVDFLTHLMNDWLIKQHYNTALSKLLRDEDGFYYEYLAGKYSKRADFGFDFQGNRMIQLLQVMLDLDVMEDNYAL